MKKRFKLLALLPAASVIVMQAVNAQEALHIMNQDFFKIFKMSGIFSHIVLLSANDRHL